jgi:hypothetical protein
MDAIAAPSSRYAAAMAYTAKNGIYGATSP